MPHETDPTRYVFACYLARSARLREVVVVLCTNSRSFSQWKKDPSKLCQTTQWRRGEIELASCMSIWCFSDILTYSLWCCMCQAMITLDLPLSTMQLDTSFFSLVTSQKKLLSPSWSQNTQTETLELVETYYSCFPSPESSAVPKHDRKKSFI